MFKRVLSLCVALVFVAGASGDLFAAPGDVRIEVDLVGVEPDSGATISIGDVIEVKVYAIKGIADTVVVSLGNPVWYSDGSYVLSPGDFGDIDATTLGSAD